MCEKILKKDDKLRTKLRNMSVGEQVIIKYDPKNRTLSSIRVSASTVGIDMGRKYRVSKHDKEVVIERIN